MTATSETQSLWLGLLGAETRYYDAGGIRTRAIESGSGDPPLIMLHGVGGHAEAFARNVVPLGKHIWSTSWMRPGSRRQTCSASRWAAGFR
jgi:pimeloyl-ACP methyl ester carboxylesterase